MQLKGVLATMAGTATLLFGLAPAFAQQPVAEPEPAPLPGELPEPVEVDPSVPPLTWPFGMSASIGGGIIGFSDEDARVFTDIGGSWEARFMLGTRQMLAAEVAYTGAAHAIDALGLDSDALLISTGLEGLARFNFSTREWQPYILVGLGWRRYDVANSDVNTSVVNDSDNLLEIPLGGGIAYRYRGMVLDLRFTFRTAADSDLVDSGQIVGNAELHTWETSLKVGWEF